MPLSVEIEAAHTSGARFVKELGVDGAIAALIEPALAGEGFRLVRVHVAGRDGKTVQIMAERPDGTMTIEDCERLSRHLSPLLDVHDFVSGSYRLEVSSPGIDRPLVRVADFRDWTGHEAKIETAEAVDGKKRFRGRLAGLEGEDVLIETASGGGDVRLMRLPLRLVAAARLVLTDDLIRQALSRSKRDAGRAEEYPGRKEE